MVSKLGWVLCACSLCGSQAQSPDPEQAFDRAVHAQERGDFAAAIEQYRLLLDRHPQAIELHVNLGVALAALNRFDEAVEQYRAALALAPGDPAIRLNLAMALHGKKDYVQALDALGPLARTSPQDVQVAILLADCEARTGHYAEAIATALPAEAAHPEDLDLAWVLGSALIQAGRAAEGLKRIETVADRNHDAEAYLLAGETRLRLAEYDTALQHADSALRLNPQLPGAHTLRGMALEHTGDLPAAMEELEQGIQQDAADVNAHIYLGAIYFFLRRLAPAREQLEQAAKLDPKSALAGYELALVKRAQGELEGAVKDMEAAALHRPDWVQPHIELSALYYRLHRGIDGARERKLVDHWSTAPASVIEPVP